MSRKGHGSVAVHYRECTPESTVEAHRARLRRHLAEALPMLQLLVAQAENCLPGPDPEAALRYLAELQTCCAATLRATRR